MTDTENKSKKKPKKLYPNRPWECRVFDDHAKLLAYSEVKKDWVAVGEAHNSAEASPEIMAQFLIDLVNDNQTKDDALVQAMDALNICLEEDRESFTFEQAAEKAIDKIRKVIS